MAQSIGSKIRGALVGILIGLLVIAFAVWGVNDVFSPASKNAVITLGKHEVSNYDFEFEFRRELTQRARQEGKQLTHQQAFDQGVHAQVLNRLLGQKIIEIDADDLGVGVNKKSAMDYVSDFEVFQDQITGKFSRDQMLSTLARMNPSMSQEGFERELIHDLRRQQTIPAINGGVVAPLGFAEKAYQFVTEQRKAKVLTLTSASVTKPEPATDAQLQAYIADNPTPFTAPEYRRITLIRLENRDVSPDLEATEDPELKVTQEDVRKLYDGRVDRGELGSPETRSVTQIIANDEDTANKAAGRLASGEDPQSVATILGLFEPIIDENVRADGVSDPNAAETAFKTEQGKTAVVQGALGKWHAVLVTDITAATQPEFSELKDELEEEIKVGKARKRINQLSKIMEEVMDDGQTLEDAAKAAKLSYSSIDFVDRSGTTPDGKKLSGTPGLEGIAEDEAILTEIFTNDIGFESYPFRTSSGGWAVLRVDDVLESKVRPFEEIKDRAASLWMSEETSKVMDTFAKDMALRAEGGETLEDILADIPQGGSIENVVIVRSAPGTKLGPTVLVGLLDASVGDVVRGDGALPATRQIGELTDIISSRDGLSGRVGDAWQEQLTVALREDLLNAYQTAIMAENPYTPYPEKIQSILGLETEE
jgi:peptidyl-prolyl cis-trans isomerase D